MLYFVFINVSWFSSTFTEYKLIWSAICLIKSSSKNCLKYMYGDISVRSGSGNSLQWKVLSTTGGSLLRQRKFYFFTYYNFLLIIVCFLIFLHCHHQLSIQNNIKYIKMCVYSFIIFNLLYMRWIHFFMFLNMWLNILYLIDIFLMLFFCITNTKINYFTFILSE